MDADRRGIVQGQRVTGIKVEQSRQLRREMTEAEQILWQALRGRQGLRFRRQQIIDGFIVDFYCHAAGVVIEVDGGIHQQQQQAEYDSARDAALAQRGLRILRVTNDDVTTHLPATLARILNFCGVDPE